jgi:hypothetical protein
MRACARRLRRAGRVPYGSAELPDVGGDEAPASGKAANHDLYSRKSRHRLFPPIYAV